VQKEYIEEIVLNIDSHPWNKTKSKSISKSSFGVARSSAHSKVFAEVQCHHFRKEFKRHQPREQTTAASRNLKLLLLAAVSPQR